MYEIRPGEVHEIPVPEAENRLFLRSDGLQLFAYHGHHEYQDVQGAFLVHPVAGVQGICDSCLRALSTRLTSLDSHIYD